jgi:hypothetical protein
MAPKSYLVGIAGEADHQSAIARCVIGERVEIIKQLDQAPSSLALTVISQRNDVLGHIPPNSWLSKAVYSRGDTCDAIIIGIRSPGRGMPLAVVLSVQLIRDPRQDPAFGRQTQVSSAMGKVRRASITRWLS